MSDGVTISAIEELDLENMVVAGRILFISETSFGRQNTAKDEITCGFCQQMLCKRGLCRRAVSVRPSVTFV